MLITQVVVVALFVCVSLGAGIQYWRRTRQAWAQVATAWQLSQNEAGRMGMNPPRLTGQIDGFDIDASFIERHVGRTSIVLRSERLPQNLRLKREGLGQTFQSVFSKDIQTEDDLFDELVLIEGDELQTVALLNSTVRAAATELIQSGGYVSDGEIHWRHTGGLVSAEQLNGRIDTLVRFAKTLELNRQDVHQQPTMLSRNALTDPLGSVRHRNLDLLLKNFPQHKVASATARQALADHLPEVRLIAAIHLQEEGHEVLKSLLENNRLPTARRCDGIRSLRSEPLRMDMAPVIRQVARSGEPTVACCAIELLAMNDDPELLDIFSHQAKPDIDKDLAIAIAQTIAEQRIEGALDILLKLLAHKTASVQIETAKALAVVGRVEAIEPLLRLTEGFFTTGDVKPAAQRAVRTIQGRLGNVSSGQLSLTDADAAQGALSVASAEAGAVSMLPELPAEVEVTE